MTSIDQQIARELGVRDAQVSAAVALLDGGATVPFIARYRKEATGALDDAQLRTLEERLRYLRELEERRTVILNSIREQGKLDDALEAAILAADSKGRLEDIYLPFKPKRRTKAEIAKEAGLEPLADLLLDEPERTTRRPRRSASSIADKQVADVAAALDGARAILVERFAEDADLIGALREELWSTGRLTSEGARRQAGSGREIQRLFRFRREAFGKSAVASRAGAVPRREGGDSRRLRSSRRIRRPRTAGASPYELQIMHRFGIADRGRPGDKWLTETARWAWRTKIQVHLGIDLRMRLWTAAEEEAVRVFAANLRDLLLAAPAGARADHGP